MMNFEEVLLEEFCQLPSHDGKVTFVRGGLYRLAAREGKVFLCRESLSTEILSWYEHPVPNDAQILDASPDGSEVLLIVDHSGGRRCIYMTPTQAVILPTDAVTSGCLGPRADEVCIAYCTEDSIRPNCVASYSLETGRLVTLLIEDRVDRGFTVTPTAIHKTCIAVSSSLDDSDLWVIEDDCLPNLIAKLSAERILAVDVLGVPNRHSFVVAARGSEREVLKQITSSFSRTLKTYPSDTSLLSLCSGTEYLYACLQVGEKKIIERCDIESPRDFEVLSIDKLAEMVGLEADDVIIKVEDWVTPPKFAHLDDLSSSAQFQTPYANYRQRRCYALGHDRTEVPFTILVNSSVPTTAALVCVYGAYGVPLDSSFSVPRLSLLDRGVAVVAAHVRGGGELGPKWHRAAVKVNKYRSWCDLISILLELRENHGIDTIAVEGNSAGAYTAAVAAHLYPNLFSALLVSAPFLDPRREMADLNHPLAAIERSEWGDMMADSSVASFYEKYSPLSLPVASYPPTLISVATQDDRVDNSIAEAWAERIVAAGGNVTWNEIAGGHDFNSGALQVKRAKEFAWLLRLIQPGSYNGYASVNDTRQCDRSTDTHP